MVFLFISIKPLQHESGMTVSLVSQGAVAFVTFWSMECMSKGEDLQGICS